jgi:Flp pilus assembly protein TadB
VNLEYSALIATALVGFGLLAALIGLVKVPVFTGKPTRTSLLLRRWHRVPRRQRLLLLGGLGAGFLAALVSGWVIAIFVLPAALIGVPWLLGRGDEPQQIERLKSMEEWTRNLAGVLVAGMSLEQALQRSLKTCPVYLHKEVSRLVGALNARTPTSQALVRFADDLDDATGDQIVASLILGAKRQGDGLARVLQDLAESVSAEVRARQQVDAGRAAHRTTARGVTLIAVVMVAALTFTGSYIDPYRTPFGQIVALVILGVFVGILVQLRLMSRTPLPPRFLKAAPPDRGSARTTRTLSSTGGRSS